MNDEIVVTGDSSAFTASYHPHLATKHVEHYQGSDTPRTRTYYDLVVQSYGAIDPRLKDADFRLLRIMLTLRQRDKRMIAGNAKLARLLGKSEDTIPAYLSRLCDAGYISRIKCGNGKGNASEYKAGPMFNLDQANWCEAQIKAATQRGSKIHPFAKGGENVRAIEHACKGGLNDPPQPNTQPINTHTHKCSLSFDKAGWMAHTANEVMFPGWSTEDREKSFGIAKTKHYINDANWQDFCPHYWQHSQNNPANFKSQSYRPAKTTHSSSAFRRTNPPPTVRSSCESPRSSLPWDGLTPGEWHAKARDWYGLGSRENWIEMGSPNFPKDTERAEMLKKLSMKSG